MKNVLLGALVGSLIVISINIILPVQTRPQPASASQATVFDHSNCQYPERWTNPADGCDNTDPAVPECTKSMYSQEAEKACIAAFVAQNQQQPQTINQPNTAQPSEAVQCGGK